MGLTLVELLVTMAVLGVLASLFLPALNRTKDKGKRAQCLNHLKQLALAQQMYPADNDGRLVENVPAPQGNNNWVPGNMKVFNSATNQILLRQGEIFPYANNPAVYHCPSDMSRIGGIPRTRSYSMNSWLGSRSMARGTSDKGYRTFIRDSELTAAGPSALWTLADEHEFSIDDPYFVVTMDDTHPFANFPATRHDQGYQLAFADCHVELYKLRDPGSAAIGQPAAHFMAKNLDWIRLKQATTVR
jgi:prepilin-type N-terminal cleavage/methylation domain-containing protein/prepilin-type processing-associated H-X9-DG protein